VNEAKQLRLDAERLAQLERQKRFGAAELEMAAKRAEQRRVETGADPKGNRHQRRKAKALGGKW
jgi:hypothetical protein